MGNAPDRWRLDIDRHKVDRGLVGLRSLRPALSSDVGDRADRGFRRALYGSVLVCPTLNCDRQFQV